MSNIYTMEEREKEFDSLERMKFLEGEKIYKKACEIFGGKLYHYNGIISLSFSIDNGVYSLGRNKVGDSDLSSMFNSEERRMVKQHINQNYRFLSNPFAYIEMYLFDNDGKENEIYDKENLAEDCSKIKHHIDLRSGKITLYRPYPKVRDNKGKIIKEIIHCILNDDTKMIECVLRFLSFLVFEHGVGKSGRPSLILYGERGTGKNFLVEHIINKMIPSMTTPLPSNFKEFNGFVEKKFVYLDENELQENMSALSRLAKRLSGGIEETVNKKGQAVYIRKINTHFCVMSNKQPINIEEEPLNDALNQWIVVKMERPLLQNSVFVNILKEYGPDLSKFIENNIGDFMFNILLPIYKECKKEFKKYRYGFPIPVNTALKELVSLSSNRYDSDTLNLVSNLIFGDLEDFKNKIENRPNTERLIKLFKLFKQDAFLSYPLIDELKFLDRMNISKTAFKRALISSGISDCKVYVINILNKRTNQRIYGYKCNKDRLKEFFGVQHIENLFDTMEEEWDLGAIEYKQH